MVQDKTGAFVSKNLFAIVNLLITVALGVAVVFVMRDDITDNVADIQEIKLDHKHHERLGLHSEADKRITALEEKAKGAADSGVIENELRHLREDMQELKVKMEKLLAAHERKRDASAHVRRPMAAGDDPKTLASRNIFRDILNEN